MYSVQELDLFSGLFSSSAGVTLVSFTSSKFLVHSSASLSTNFFLHLQFSQSKYSPISHDLSHSYSQLLGFQIIPLSQVPLSINSLHSHLHLSSFHLCLLSQTLESSLYLHLQVSCYSMCLVSLVRNISLNALTFKFLAISGTHNFACGSLILLQLPLHLLVLILKRKNTGSLL